jgi:PKD repeat protein
MSENLNWLDQLKRSFQGFEPEVTGDWKRMEQNLDAINAGTTNEMARRMRNAQRIAVGATAIAAGMALWVITPTILEEENATGSGVATSTEVSANEAKTSDVASSAQSLFSPAGDATDVFPSEGARTSNTFVIDLPSLTVKGEAPTESSSSKHTETPKGQPKASVEQSNQPQHSMGVTEAGEEEEALVLSPEAKLDAALAAMTASAQEACAGTEVTFALNGLDQEGSVLWNFGDGGFSQEVAPTHIYDDAGSYDITVSVRAPGDGMIRTRTVENMIVVRPKPEAAMDWEFFDATSNRARVHFINETEDASSSTWLLEQEGLTEAQAVLDVPGDYHVNLVASNKFGCQDIAVQDIHLGSRKEAIAPALFSPDGDGRYDTFMPLMLMDFKGKWELTIWDGDEQVFESSKTRRPWKGELANGGAAEVGKKYTWKLVAETPAGEKHLFVDEVLIDGE